MTNYLPPNRKRDLSTTKQMSVRQLLQPHAGALALGLLAVLGEGAANLLQPLRQLELDARREIGIIFRDSKVIKAMVRTFEEDWSASEPPKEHDAPAVQAARKIARVISKRLPVEPVVKQVMKTIEKNGKDAKAIESTLKSVVKEVLNESMDKAAEEVTRDLEKESA